MRNRIILCTGGYDPLHSGHIAYFEQAKKLGDILVVGVNSDQWLARKKGQAFMNINERTSIVNALKVVDSVITFDDSDGSASGAIRHCLDTYSESDIIFANGGDRTKTNIPEMNMKLTAAEANRLQFVFGIGGEYKLNSSSKILTEWKNPKTLRKWGYYRVLHSEGPSLKVKELVVEPGKSLSLQRHHMRSEYWMVAHGIATVNHGSDINKLSQSILLQHDEIQIPTTFWHQLVNDTDDEVRIIEVQYGTNCIEEDIERN
jgi:cytidyltransferase-like protein